eukprot:tig00020509_g9762.t1
MATETTHAAAAAAAAPLSEPAAPRSIADLPDEILRMVTKRLGPWDAKRTLGSTNRRFRDLVKNDDGEWAALCKTQLGIVVPEDAPPGTAYNVYAGFFATRCRLCFERGFWKPSEEPMVMDPLLNMRLCSTDARCDRTPISSIYTISYESKNSHDNYGLYGNTIPHLVVDAAGRTNYAALVRERERRRGLPARPGLLSMAEIVKRYHLVPRRNTKHRPRGALAAAGYDPETLEERFDPADIRAWLVDEAGAGIPDPEGRARNLERAAEYRKRRRGQFEQHTAPAAHMHATAPAAPAAGAAGGGVMISYMNYIYDVDLGEFVTAP